MTAAADSRGPNEFVKEAYSLKDDEKMVDFYRKWADDYDQQMLVERGDTSPISMIQPAP